MSTSFVQIREQASELSPKRSSRVSNRISFTQNEYAEKKSIDERVRRGSFPGLCDSSCLRARNEFRQLEGFNEYKPQMYNFHIQDYDEMKGIIHNEDQQGNLQIKCPDFHVLFDHTVALVFLFYNDVKNWRKFTIPHLEWALKFIDAIKSSTGMPFTDMDTIKKHLEDFLFMKYSEVDSDKFYDFKPMPPPPIDPCPARAYTDDQIPISLRELFHNVPALLLTVLGPPPQHMTHGDTSPNEHVTKALVKLEEFEWKNIERINDEIDMFELIKCIKSQIGGKDKIGARDLSNLKEKIEQLENKWMAHH